MDQRYSIGSRATLACAVALALVPVVGRAQTGTQELARQGNWFAASGMGQSGDTALRSCSARGDSVSGHSVTVMYLDTGMVLLAVGGLPIRDSIESVDVSMRMDGETYQVPMSATPDGLITAFEGDPTGGDFMTGLRQGDRLSVTIAQVGMAFDVRLHGAGPMIDRALACRVDMAADGGEG